INPLRRALENSLLLRQFAERHQDEILAALESDTLGDRWVDRFDTYAAENDFAFDSPLTALALELKATADLDNSSLATSRVAESVIRRARQLDRVRLQQDGGYIKDRLARIAYERKYGTYRTYKEVLIHSRPEIEFASKLLVKGD
ncbi:MAG: hypothetical protein JSW34_02410, partial [Candidatus Zixiibacteriota bacterium]